MSKTDDRPQIRILSYNDLRARGIRFSRQWILKLQKAGKFPQAVRLGEASTGFVESEINKWVEDLIAERDKKEVA
jgi:prophage regulatory protein